MRQLPARIFSRSGGRAAAWVGKEGAAHRSERGPIEEAEDRATARRRRTVLGRRGSGAGRLRSSPKAAGDGEAAEPVCGRSLRALRQGCPRETGGMQRRIELERELTFWQKCHLALLRLDQICTHLGNKRNQLSQ